MSGNKLKKVTTVQTAALTIVRHELKAMGDSSSDEKRDELPRPATKKVIYKKGYIRPPKYDFL